MLLLKQSRQKEHTEVVFLTVPTNTLLGPGTLLTNGAAVLNEADSLLTTRAVLVGPRRLLKTGAAVV